MKEQLKKAKAIIEGYDGPAVRVMEVCGTHTHEIFHLGVRKILPPQVERCRCLPLKCRGLSDVKNRTHRIK